MPIDLPKNRDVVRWMLNNSKRPHVAVQTWATVIISLDVFTGEILLTRREIATESNATPNEVSEIMSELVRYGAISRLRKGGRVHYSVIPPFFVQPPHRDRKEAPTSGEQLAVMTSDQALGVPPRAPGQDTPPDVSRRNLVNLALGIWEDWRERFSTKRETGN